MASRASDSRSLVVDMTYRETLREDDREAFEREFFNVLENLGFTVIAGSRRGVSAAAPRETIESTFQAEIVMMAERAEGGTFGPEAVTRLSFSSPPVIPAALAPYVTRVHFSPPAIPLM